MIHLQTGNRIVIHSCNLMSGKISLETFDNQTENRQIFPSKRSHGTRWGRYLLPRKNKALVL